MNLDNITTQPFILSLFKRDDGVRFLLGSGAYEFKNSQLHFVANAFMNDVVEVQGNDGALLAGQVRRAKVQPFDGYVGDGSTIKSKIEQYRTNFMKFFQKNHFYTVIYIFPDGTAIQRRRGYIVDAPEVKELYQTAPEYHIAFNFEDVNYYKYSENDEGEETYSNLAEILSSITVAGGLVWTQGTSGTETRTETGKELVLTDSTDDGFDDVEILGDTEQHTYTGKNLLNMNAENAVGTTKTNGTGLTAKFNADQSVTISGTTTSANSDLELFGAWGHATPQYINLPAGTYTIKFYMTGNLDSVGRAIYLVNSSTVISGLTTLEAGTTVKTATFSTNQPITELLFRIVNSGTTVNGTLKIQLESGSTATSYEPYVGGIASPNPDYPQTVQTVTGEQTITITDGDSQTSSYLVSVGKNLFSTTNISGVTDAFTDNHYSSSTTRTTSQDWVKLKAGTYTFNATTGTGKTLNISTVTANTDGSTLYIPGLTGRWMSLPCVFTINQDILWKMNLRFSDNSDMSPADVSNIQLEKGSTATTYEPPVELCKIGTYQDYIYKNGDDWYVHKEIGKIIADGSESWTAGATPNRVALNQTGAIVGSADTNYILSDRYIAEYANTNLRTFLGANAAQNGQININDSVNATSVSTWTTYLSTHPTTFYFALATATDTQITDATLISQLEALLGADTYDGGTNVSITGDLAGFLTITYTASLLANGGVEWDNYGAVWEEGGGGGGAIITVDSITNVSPTIRITGPALNPILTNITTGQAIKYYGNILSSQTLVIDTNQKTAKLNGTSVIQNVDGDWLELAPGNNRMEYTVDNADQVSATIEWQEIVG